MSSLSSNSMVNTSNGARGSQRALDVNALRADDWSYLAEGGLHLLVRYVGPAEGQGDSFGNEKGDPPVKQASLNRLALRIRKRSRALPAPEQASLATPELDPVHCVVQDLLGPEHTQVPEPLHLNGEANTKALSLFLHRLADQVEPVRPEHRRQQDGIDLVSPHVSTVLDMTSGNESDLTVEIKPKWLFLPCQPEGATSASVSRYHMHVVHRAPQLSYDRWKRLYDPLDLSSSSSERVERAIGALWDQAASDDCRMHKNNFRLFRNGHPIDLTESTRPVALISKEEVAKDYAWTQSILRPPTPVETQQVGRAVQILLNSAHSPLGQPTSNDTDQQLLDTLESLESPEHGALPPAPNKKGQDDMVALRALLVAYTLGATFKDLSLMIRLGSSAALPEIKAVDVDGKPISRMGKWYRLDQDIANSFRVWAQRYTPLATTKSTSHPSIDAQ